MALTWDGHLAWGCDREGGLSGPCDKPIGFEGRN